MTSVEDDSSQPPLFVLDIEERIAFHRLGEKNDLALACKCSVGDFLGDVVRIVLVVRQIVLEALTVLLSEFGAVCIRCMALLRAFPELRRRQILDGGLVVPLGFLPADPLFAS